MLGYCILIRGDLISWKSKKQNVVARLSAEVGYQAMALTTYKLICLKQLIQELQPCVLGPMEPVCGNQAALHIVSNLVFNERNKHIEIDCHFIWKKVVAKEISAIFVNSNNKLANMLTKSLQGPLRMSYISDKFCAYDIYAPV